MNKKVLGIIPARLNSTRLPQKLIKKINGKPLIYHTWNQALKAKTLNQVIIATDDKQIFNLCKEFGAYVVMTSSKIKCGSDRVAVAAKKFKLFKPDIVVNIQGDEPMIPPQAIDDCVEALIKDREAVVSTPATTFLSPLDFKSPSFVKVVANKKGHALYFSRAIIPYPREKFNDYHKHLGLYVYKADFLQKYVKLPQTKLEQAEKLEQLRILENDYKIKLVVGNYRNMEVNTPGELRRARQMMRLPYGSD